MSALVGKNVVVVGGSLGVGRAIADQADAAGARVLIFSRNPPAPGCDGGGAPKWQQADAATEEAPGQVFTALLPDVLIISAGAQPPVEPLHQLSWEGFSVNWESDVKASFLFSRAALRRPLAPGSHVILISSGAAMGGSPISGGYAGAKRTQMFITRYAQRESDRLRLGLTFTTLAPARIMAETRLGQRAANGYAAYLGMPADQFLAGMEGRQTPDEVARIVLQVAAGELAVEGGAALITAKGLEAVA
jgi:NAD(P)-dependent dehydrogenase (short-subunit alcohol dehydrogenase family)